MRGKKKLRGYSRVWKARHRADPGGKRDHPSPAGTRSGIPSGKRKAEAGFTLLEVLVSLAVLGLAVTVVMQLFSANLKNLFTSEGYVTATLEAQSLLRRWLEEDLSEGTRTGMSENGYRYRVVIREPLPERTENLPLKLWEVEVNVYWPQGPGEKAVSLKGMKMAEKRL